MNYYSKQISTLLEKKIVDAEEKANGNNVDSQKHIIQLINIKWEYYCLLSIYYAQLDGMFWNCRRSKKVITL